MGRLIPCPECEAAVSKKALACPNCGFPLEAGRKQIGCLGVSLILVVLFILVGLLRRSGAPRGDGPGAVAPPQAPAIHASQGMMPEVAAFLLDHPEFGRPRGPRNLVDWAHGKFQRIDFYSGKSLTFYELKGRIITVWDKSPDAENEIIWGKPYEPEPFVPVEREAADEIPAYKLIDVMELLGGGKHGDAIVPSLSVDTTPEERERIAGLIASREAVGGLTVYCSEEARTANLSASFSASHPGALEQGYLGTLEDGRFNLPFGFAEAAEKRKQAQITADQVAAHRSKLDKARPDFTAVIEKARKAASRFPKSRPDLRDKAKWRVFEDQIRSVITGHSLSMKDVDELRVEFPDFLKRYSIR